MTTPMPKPDKAKGERKPITTKNPPGGPSTPGAKADAKAGAPGLRRKSGNTR